jgi:AcrR family transcriptional regulator
MSERRPRADAVRNRERILVAAQEAFAAEGPSVSLDDVARRAGVGAGTVHRHFPTKDELFSAVIAGRMRDLADGARDLADASDPGEAFFGFFHQMADQARQNLALSAALTEPLGDTVREAGHDLESALGALLDRAQKAGAVRLDFGIIELHAVIAGALVMEQRLPPASRGRGLEIVADGLKA